MRQAASVSAIFPTPCPTNFTKEGGQLLQSGGVGAVLQGEGLPMPGEKCSGGCRVLGWTPDTGPLGSRATHASRTTWGGGSQHILSTYCVPGTEHILSILSFTPGVGPEYFHLTLISSGGPRFIPAYRVRMLLFLSSLLPQPLPSTVPKASI